MLSRNYVFHVGRKSFFKIQSISLVVLPLCPVPVMKINVSSEGDGVGGGGGGRGGGGGKVGFNKIWEEVCRRNPVPFVDEVAAPI